MSASCKGMIYSRGVTGDTILSSWSKPILTSLSTPLLPPRRVWFSELSDWAVKERFQEMHMTQKLVVVFITPLIKRPWRPTLATDSRIGLFFSLVSSKQYTGACHLASSSTLPTSNVITCAAYPAIQDSQPSKHKNVHSASIISNKRMFEDNSEWGDLLHIPSSRSGTQIEETHRLIAESWWIKIG